MQNKLPKLDFPIKLSLGCGERDEELFMVKEEPFNSELPPEGYKKFVGLDERDLGQEITWKILDGIPLPNESVEFIWASHIMEHFDSIEILEVMEECWRVLIKDGILEIRCPDESSSVSRMPFHKQVIHWDYFNIFFNESNLEVYGYHKWELVERKKYLTKRGLDLKFILRKK